MMEDASLGFQMQQIQKSQIDSREPSKSKPKPHSPLYRPARFWGISSPEKRSQWPPSRYLWYLSTHFTAGSEEFLVQKNAPIFDEMVIAQIQIDTLRDCEWKLCLSELKPSVVFCKLDWIRYQWFYWLLAA